MLVNVLQWHAGIENFYKCTHSLIKMKCSSPFNLDLRNILTIFFSVILAESCLFNMVILNQTQVLAKNTDL